MRNFITFCFIALSFYSLAQCPIIQTSDFSFATDGVCAPVEVTGYSATYTFLSAQDPNDITIRFEWNDPGTTVDDFTNGGWKDMGLPSNIIFKPKADKNYVVVGAASIIAKFIRDSLLQKCLRSIGAPMISGYPSDPKTILFLKEYYKKNKSFPSFCRLSWKTCEKIINAQI